MNVSFGFKMQSFYIRLISVLCILACFTDVLLLFVLGSKYPGFQQLYDPISALGANKSPVGHIVSTWWIILGFIFIFFAFAYKKAFRKTGKHVITAFWLILLYGVGEGIGSGLFPGNHLDNHLTVVGIFHNIFGGVGVVAVCALPFVLLKEFSRQRSVLLYSFSLFIAIAGIVFFVLFSVSRFLEPGNGIISMHGLWQRFYLGNYYLYFLMLSINAIQETYKSNQN